MTLNIEALRRVVSFAVIDHDDSLNLPFRWDQGTWGRINGTLIPEDVQVRESSNDDGEYKQFVEVTCATACCLAGNTVLANGDKFILPVGNYSRISDYTDDESIDVNECVDEDGVVHQISRRAQEILGITDYEREVLFSGGNGIEAVCFYAEAIAIAHGTTLDMHRAAELAAKFCAYECETPQAYAEQNFGIHESVTA